MHDADTTDVRLFSYGSLRQKEVQLTIFGRELEGQADTLPGFAASALKITDPDVIATSGSAEHIIVRRTDNPHDRIPGMVFKITQTELLAADAYEVADYKRVTVRLGSGIDAFVYVDANT